ncbi:MAG: hypothetical protein M3463_04555 [Verrucomicrobiota bacterium]|nr:hypothetical protein [Verrucomicrobiota bacterium]
MNPSALRAEEWQHLAVCWDTEPERGWVSELYLDGKPAIPWLRRQTGLGRYMEDQRKGQPPMPWGVEIPRSDFIVLLGSIEACDRRAPHQRRAALSRPVHSAPKAPLRSRQGDAPAAPS